MDAVVDTDKMSADLAADLTGNMDLSPVEEPVDEALEPTPEDTPAEPTDAPGANRGPDGRFTKAAEPAAPTEPVADPAAPVPADEYAPPKSWAKEVHGLWEKAARGDPLTKDESRALLKTFTMRESQMADGAKAYATDAEYGRSLRGIVGKHEDILRAQGIEAPKAIEYFFNSHRQLSNPDRSAARAYLAKVAQHYGITLETPASDPNAPAPAALPPEVNELRERQDRIEAALNETKEREYAARRERMAGEVTAFASDPKHQYFDEVAEHLVHLIAAEQQAGRQPVLATLYDTAVWANPVTRQKELSRLQQERDEANRKKAQEAANAAKKSTSTNVKGRDTARAPQAPAATLNNLDDVMRETHEEMKSRVE